MDGPSGQNGFGLSNLNGGANIAQNFTVPTPPLPLHQWPLPLLTSLLSAIPPSNHGSIANPSIANPLVASLTFQQQLALLTASIPPTPAIPHANLNLFNFECLKPQMSNWIVAASSSGMAKQMQRWIGGDVPVTRVKE